MTGMWASHALEELKSTSASSMAAITRHSGCSSRTQSARTSSGIDSTDDASTSTVTRSHRELAVRISAEWPAWSG